MNNKISGIYKIINTIDGKYYVGSSDNILGSGGRWKEHINDLQANRHCNSYLQKAWNKYGSNAFKFVIIEQISPKKLIEVEQKYLNIAKPEYHKQTYNLSFHASGGGGFFGHKHSKESKRKTSIKLKGRISPNKGKRHPEISGENNPHADQQIYSFVNKITGEEFTGKRCNFVNKYNLWRQAVRRLILKKSQSHCGWILQQ